MAKPRKAVRAATKTIVAALPGARPREWSSVLSQIATLARFARLAGRSRIATQLETLRTRLETT